jgi:hypothetical protein
MKNNTVPALIIATAILLSAFFTHWASTRTALSAINQIEAAVLTKNSEGKTRTTELVEGLVSSVSEGFRSGLSVGGADDSEKAKIESEARGKLTLREVKLARGERNDEERVIGIVRNDSTAIVTRADANVIFRDQNGALIDVKNSARLFDDSLNPGQEVGFEVERSLGDFSEEEGVLASRKAAAVSIVLLGVTVSEEKTSLPAVR